MKKKHNSIIRYGLTLSGVLPLLITGGCTYKQSKPQNVIFFLVDDLGWADVTCYGSEFYETPNIDQLANEGVRFTSAYAACHVCSPTRASILTGKYPASINLTDWLPGRREFAFQRFSNADKIQQLPYEEITLAEALKTQGYATGIIGKWHLGEDPSNPMAHGFDMHIPNWAKGWPNAGYYAPFELEGIPDAPGEYLTDRLTDKALSFIENHADEPFFLYFSHFSVHDPIEGRPDIVEKYEEKLRSMPPPEGHPFILEGNPDSPDFINPKDALKLLEKDEYKGFSQLPNQMVKIKQFQDNVQFAAMVESTDESLGRVMNKLKELGLDKNTIIIFFSDNGGMSAANFGNPNRIVHRGNLDRNFATSNLPLRGAKGWLYEGGIRVPLIIKWPEKGKKGIENDVPVTSPDFYPTIMEMLGFNVPEDQKVDGISITPLLKGRNSLNRNHIYWHFPHYSNHGMQSPGGAIRSGDYKLIEYFENNTVQLFNLKNDIGEEHDLAAVKPDIARKLQTELSRWRIEVDAQMLKPNPLYQAE
jgi:arylsulfatase A